MNALEWLGTFAVENFIKCQEWKDTIPALMIVSSLEFGTTKSARLKIEKWMTQEGTGIDLSRSPHKKYFDKCWERLEKNGVFKKGKVHAVFSDEHGEIELALLIGVARSHLKRGPRPRVAQGKGILNEI